MWPHMAQTPPQKNPRRLEKTPNVGNKRQPKAVRLIDGLGVTVAQARQRRNARTQHERRQKPAGSNRPRCSHWRQNPRSSDLKRHISNARHIHRAHASPGSGVSELCLFAHNPPASMLTPKRQNLRGSDQRGIASNASPKEQTCRHLVATHGDKRHPRRIRGGSRRRPTFELTGAARRPVE